MFDYRGMVVVITGASSGLGLQMAKAYAKNGANLALLARRTDRLEEISKEIKELGVDCISVKCDVTDTGSVDDAAKIVLEHYKKIDVLVNNAGSSKNAGLCDMTDEEWDFTISTDLSSVFKVSRVFSKSMVENNYGRIINIASMYGLVGNTAVNTIAYHAAKGGVVNFTRAAAAELAKNNITVNAICPGYFETELTKDVLNTEAFTTYMKTFVPLGRYGKEGELDAAAIFLGSLEASYITGQMITVDGGYTSI